MTREEYIKNLKNQGKVMDKVANDLLCADELGKGE